MINTSAQAAIEHILLLKLDLLSYRKLSGKPGALEEALRHLDLAEQNIRKLLEKK